jgi:hypothetical protein
MVVNAGGTRKFRIAEDRAKRGKITPQAWMRCEPTDFFQSSELELASPPRGCRFTIKRSVS